MTKPYRPAPSDFRETYIRMGWDGIADHYNTNYRCIARWIEECGGEELRQARSEVTGLSPRPHRRSKRYVLGRTLRPAQSAPASPWDAICTERQQGEGA